MGRSVGSPFQSPGHAYVPCLGKVSRRDATVNYVPTAPDMDRSAAFFTDALTFERRSDVELGGPGA